MRILYIASDTNLFYNQIGGAGTHLRATIEYLEKKHDVSKAIGGDLLSHKNVDETTRAKTIKRRSWKAFIPSSLKLLFQDIRIFRRNKMVLAETERLIVLIKPDVIYERSCYGYSVGYKLAKKYNIPRCMETDVLMFDLKRGTTSFFFNRFFYRFLERRKFLTADVITVQSEYSVDLCKKYWKIKHNRVFNKDLGIDIAKKVNHENTNKIDIVYNLSGKFVVGFVGIFQKYQRVHLLINAAEELRHHPDVCFLIVGTGWKYEEMLTEVKKRRLDNILFVGKIPSEQIHNIYNRMDVGVIPDCAYHMYPVKFLEYSLYKKATIIPDYNVFYPFFPSIKDFRQVTFARGNSKELAQRVEYLKENPEFRNYIGEYSSNYVKANHSWDKCGALVENALVEAIRFKTKG